jgi:hypothetical protein
MRSKCRRRSWLANASLLLRAPAGASQLEATAIATGGKIRELLARQ